jgi:hypothetical protein
MSSHLRRLAIIVACSVLPVAAAHAQWFGSAAPVAPAYAAYDAQPQGPYAVEVAPNTYVIHRPGAQRARCVTRKPSQRALTEGLHRRSHVKRKVIETTKIVHDPPIVIEHQRVVDDPPRMIERRHVVADAPAGRGLIQPRHVVDTPPRRAPAQVARPAKVKRARGKAGQKHVIHADAEITILGPGSISIRLTRKRGGGDASLPR